MDLQTAREFKDDYRAAMVRDRRVMVRVSMSRVGPDRHG